MRSVALVATLGIGVALGTGSCADRSGSRDVAVAPAPTAGWGAESVAWIQQFFELTDAHGGLGATPFLAPDVVLDHRSFIGPAGHAEGVDEAVALVDEFTGGIDSVSDRWAFSDAPYLDPRGAVITSEVNVGPDLEDLSLHRYGAVFMDIGRHGIERQIFMPSTRWRTERDQTHRTGPADRAEALVSAWTSAWSGDDPLGLGLLYAADVALVDEVVGVDVGGRRAVVDRWTLSRSTDWSAVAREGAPAVYLSAPLFQDDDGRLGVLAEITADAGDGCPGRLAVWWELDSDDRIVLERRLRSADDARRCVPAHVLPQGWWTGRPPPAEVDAGELEDLDTVTHVIVEGDITTEIRNGTPSLAALAGWGLGRFDLAGLRLPDVRQVTFTTMSAYCEDIQGRAIELSPADASTGAPLPEGWEVVLCLDDADLYVDDAGAMPSPRAHYVLLHELAHVWLAQNLDATTRQYFLESLGLETWNSEEHPWDERGNEWAACFVAWGLMDRALPLFEIDEPPTELRFQGYQLLTGRRPLRPADLSD